MRTGSLALLLLCAAPLGGCGPEDEIYITDARKANGLVVILPGIEGPSPLNRDIREGLLDGGVPGAMVIRPWGVPVPGVGALVNQMNPMGNRLAGAEVARMIAEYQDVHPGAPVWVVGHSGGGGVAVFTAEALAEMDANRRIDGLVLLSASLSNDYDLTKAVGATRHGLVNFYNPGDTLLLGLGTGLLGNVDGGRAPSAGLEGFARDFPLLYQVEVAPDGGNPHASTTRVPYVSSQVAPWLLADAWPVSASRGGRARTAGKPEPEKAARTSRARTQRDRPASRPSSSQPSTSSRSPGTTSRTAPESQSRIP